MADGREKNFRILEFQNNEFDIIGDIHGCYMECVELVKKLGYEKKGRAYVHPQGRRLISVGDIADKGCENIQCIEFWMNQVQHGGGFWLHGNHCNKLYRYFLGNKVQIAHGLEDTVREVENLSKEKRVEFRNQYTTCYESQCYYLLLDKKKLAVVHGGLLEEDLGKFNNRIKTRCLYGQPTGRLDEKGLPERYNWAEKYSGETLVVYGHTVTEEAVFFQNTIDIDQGCVYGGQLTAFRYPEREIVQVQGRKIRVR